MNQYSSITLANTFLSANGWIRSKDSVLYTPQPISGYHYPLLNTHVCICLGISDNTVHRNKIISFGIYFFLLTTLKIQICINFNNCQFKFLQPEIVKNMVELVFIFLSSYKVSKRLIPRLGQVRYIKTSRKNDNKWEK